MNLSRSWLSCAVILLAGGQTFGQGSTAGRANVAAVATAGTLTRIFRLNPNSLMARPEASAALLGTETNIQEIARQFFAAAGVEFSPDAGCTFFFNDRTGVLLVRGNEELLKQVENALAALANEPVHVRVEVRVTEIAEGDELLNDLQTGSGPDSLVPVDSNELGPAVEKMLIRQIPAKSIKVLTESQMRELWSRLEKKGGTDLLQLPIVETVSGRQVRVPLQDEDETVTDPPFHAPRKRQQSQP